MTLGNWIGSRSNGVGDLAKQFSQIFKDIHREVGSFSSTHNEGPSDIHKWWEMGGGGQLGGTGEVGRQGDKQKLLRSSTLSLSFAVNGGVHLFSWKKSLVRFPLFLGLCTRCFSTITVFT